MPSQEQSLRQQYATILAAFEAAFPSVTPPEPHWFRLWMSKYDCLDILHAIATLAQHPLKSRFSQESTGRAISSLLRNEALRRAVPSTPKAVRS